MSDQPPPVSAEQRIREKLTTHSNAEWAVVEAFDAIMAELQAAQEREKAAKVELGRHLCFTNHAAQRDFWTRVEDRAAQRTEEASDNE